jgi:hypothetical protein
LGSRGRGGFGDVVRRLRRAAAPGLNVSLERVLELAMVMA